jgi:predicted nucleic acid-binding protein
MTDRATLVDANVLLDILTDDPTWSTWSGDALASAADSTVLVINPIVYGEVSVRFSRIEELDDVLAPQDFARHPLPWSAAFLAGKCYLDYRRQGGTRRSPLPDFYIGAHAAVAGFRLLTRDARRYRKYFPRLPLLTPE